MCLESFNILDNDRTPNCFKEEKIWIVYDDDNGGMYELYAKSRVETGMKTFLHMMNIFMKWNGFDL